jgi:uncharacterized protein YrrD
MPLDQPKYGFFMQPSNKASCYSHEENSEGDPMRVSEVLGKPIVSTDTGAKGGRVEDLLLDDTRHQIVGVLISDGMLSKQRVLPFDEVQTAGVDALVVKTLTTIRDASEWLAEGRPAHRSRAVSGKDVVTGDGAKIGTLRDLLADERTGALVALEVDTGRHAALVRDIGGIALGNDVVVVPGAVAATLAKD